MMQAQMKKIREQHGLNPIQTPAYYNRQQVESSSDDLSSDDDIDQTSGVGDSSATSLSQSMASEKNVYSQVYPQKRPALAPFSHPKYSVPRSNAPSHVEIKRTSPMAQLRARDGTY